MLIAVVQRHDGLMARHEAQSHRTRRLLEVQSLGNQPGAHHLWQIVIRKGLVSGNHQLDASEGILEKTCVSLGSENGPEDPHAPETTSQGCPPALSGAPTAERRVTSRWKKKVSRVELVNSRTAPQLAYWNRGSSPLIALSSIDSSPTHSFGIP